MIDQLQTTNVRAAKDIRRKIHLRERLLHEQNQTVKGRQLIWLILNSYARDSERRKFATMTDLREVKWRGPEHVAEFIDEWTYFRQRIFGGWSDDEILQVLTDKLRREKSLRIAFTLYDMLPHEEQTEEWIIDKLYKMEENNVKTRNEEAYRQARLEGASHNYYEIQGVHGPAAPAHYTGGGKHGKGTTGKGYHKRGRVQG